MDSISLTHLALTARRYWPMHIASGDSAAGFRIGGAPPVGVTPEHPKEWTQYFGTFPISIGNGKAQEMSIFCSFNYDDPDDPCFITDHIYKALVGDVVQCVFHSPARRAKESQFRSELDAYRVEIGKDVADDFADESGGAPHQIGGVPFFQDEHPRVRKTSADLFEMGYLYALRWSFPGGGDCAVRGNWPFHNYSFHVYLKMTDQGFDYRAMLV